MRDHPLEERTIGRILAAKAATVGERPFLLFEGQRFSYADAHAITNGYAEGFRRAGIGAASPSRSCSTTGPNCCGRCGGWASSARSRSR